jgi:aminoglycoside phosphotransferase (APT) family kinase protein
VTEEEPSLCHNDFHPLNILVADDGALTLLDWADASVGDRLHDVARTLALFRVAWIAAGSAAERVALRLARGFLASRYLTPYRRILPFDAARLRYWQALQTYAGWLQLVELEQAGPAVEGVRQDSVARLPPALLAQVRDDFRRLARG